MRSRKRGSKGASNACTSFVKRVKLRPSSRATMCRPGRTHRSWAVSNTRILRSRSSNFIFPLLDDDAISLVDPHVIQIVEAFILAGDLQSARCSENAGHRNALLGRALFVAPFAVLDFGLEV